MVVFLADLFKHPLSNEDITKTGQNIINM